MNQIPVAGIDVGKRFSEMALLSPFNEVFARIRINHDAYSNFDRAFELLRKAEKEFGGKACRRHGIHRPLPQNPFPNP